MPPPPRPRRRPTRWVPTTIPTPLCPRRPAPAVDAGPGGARPIGFTPGVVDGKMGMSTVNALKGFQESRGLQVTGELDEPTVQALAQWKHIPATASVTIPPEFANDQFVAIPKEREDQAKLGKMGYGSLGEKVAERFHTTEEVLAELNPHRGGARRLPTAPPRQRRGRRPSRPSPTRRGCSCACPTSARTASTPRRSRTPNGPTPAPARRWNRAAQGGEDRGRQVRPGAPACSMGEGKLLAQFTGDHGFEHFRCRSGRGRSGRRLQSPLAL